MARSANAHRSLANSEQFLHAKLGSLWAPINQFARLQSRTACCTTHPDSRPKRSIQRPILDCLRDVPRLDGFGPGKVGHRARDFENAVVRPRAKALLRHGPFQQVLGVRTQLAVLPDLTRAHLSIGVNALAFAAEAHQLRLAGANATARP